MQKAGQILINGMFWLNDCLCEKHLSHSIFWMQAKQSSSHFLIINFLALGQENHEEIDYQTEQERS